MLVICRSGARLRLFARGDSTLFSEGNDDYLSDGDRESF